LILDRIERKSVNEMQTGSSIVGMTWKDRSNDFFCAL